MTRNNIRSGFAKLLWLVVSVTAAIAFILSLRWGLHQLAIQSSLIGSLVFSLLAPFGVVLFALLVEQIGGNDQRLAASVRQDVRYIRIPSK